MGIETAPAFQFYVKEWRSSRAVQRMSLSERGVYFEMLCEQWENLTLADDPKEVAALLATTAAQEVEIEAAWTVVRRNFVCAPEQPGRILNERLERVRRERRRFVKIAKKGGKARAEQALRSASGTFQPLTSRAPAGEPAVAPADIQPEHQQGDQPPSSTTTTTATATASSSATASATASAKKEHVPRDKPRDEAFDAFWAAYPRKTGKDAAFKAWQKRRRELPPVEQLLASLAGASASRQWTRDDGQYIPHPATWLNEGRWQDEPEEQSLLAVSDTSRRNFANIPDALRLIEENELARQR